MSGGVPGIAGSPTTGGPGVDLDFSAWSIWWEFNKDAYLDLKAHLHSGASVSGDDGWFLGHGATRPSYDGLRPTEEQIRLRVVPALLAALERDPGSETAGACLIALGKIGEAALGEALITPVLMRFLADRNQEVSESAALALGILGSVPAIRPLEALLLDSVAGRELVGRGAVNDRVRSFAAYGLGLVGARTDNEDARRRIVGLLHRAFMTDETRSRDLEVACIVAMGIVPLETLGLSPRPSANAAPQALPPYVGRLAQLETLLALLRDEDQDTFVRAQCVTALARLLSGLPATHLADSRARIAGALLDVLSGRRERDEVVQSVVLALGAIGTSDGRDPTDQRIRAALAAQAREGRDLQARGFALIAMAEVGARSGAERTAAGVEEVRKLLLEQLIDGRPTLRPWAGLACGVLSHSLSDASGSSAFLEDALRAALRDEGDPAHVGAYALGCGIARDREALPLLLKRLDGETQDEARGYLALALGLAQAREGLEPIQRIVAGARYRPELLGRTAMALVLLGDKSATPNLLELLAEAKSVATQASLASAVGHTGDRRAIELLVAMLENGELSARSRAFAAAALGIVTDKEPLHWSAKIRAGLNYRAAPPTLSDMGSGTGILDIL